MPAEALRKVKVPVLAMNGSRDVQAPPAQNLPAIVTALTAGTCFSTAKPARPASTGLWKTHSPPARSTL